MTLPLTGGCLCGAIRYACDEAPLQMLFCHCRDCQQAGGGPYSAAVIVAKKAFCLTQGEPGYFTSPSLAGGHHTRGFCPACGSRILGAIAPDRDFLGLLASSLDDPAIFQPQCHIFVSDAQPWDRLDDGLPRFQHYAPQKR